MAKPAPTNDLMPEWVDQGITDDMDNTNERFYDVQGTDGDDQDDNAIDIPKMLQDVRKSNKDLDGLGEHHAYGHGGNDVITGDLYAVNCLFGGGGNDIITGGNKVDILYGDVRNGHVFYGTDESHDDTLSGLGGRDLLRGGLGNDRLYGGDGADRIYGGAGDDFIEGGAGGDMIDGGDGIDTVSFADPSIKAGVTVNLAMGKTGTTGKEQSATMFENLTRRGDFERFIKSDIANIVTNETDHAGDDLFNIENVIGTKFRDLLTGDENANVLEGGAGDDELSGGGGNDVLEGGAGNDVLEGGVGDDVLEGGAGNDVLSGGGGNDVLEGGVGDDVLEGGVGDDVLEGGAGGDELSGGEGNDVLEGGVGDDVLEGGVGDDVLEGGAGGDELSGGGGSDTASYKNSEKFVVVFLSNDNDMFPSTGAGFKIIPGGNPAELIVDFSQMGHRTGFFVSITQENDYDKNGNVIGTAVRIMELNTMSYSEAHGDKLESIENSRYVFESIENLEGSAHDDVLGGDLGSNFLDGGAGDDHLYGGDGDDELQGGAGADRLYGGAGEDDWASYTSAEERVVVNGVVVNGVVASLGDSAINQGDAFGDTYDSIENIRGSDHDDELTGDGSGNEIDGGAGGDTIRGGDGTDVINGGEGNDSLYGGDGTDVINGGEGNDSLYGEGGTDMLKGGQGKDQLYGGDGQDNLDGGRGNDYLYGEANIDTLNGGDGDDFLYGGDGIDTLMGGDGEDYLDGGEGIDTLIGGARDDSLYGGAGGDTLIGGDGEDSLYGGAGTNALQGQGGYDRYYFNVRGSLDTITDGEGDNTIHFISIGEYEIDEEHIAFGRSGLDIKIVVDDPSTTTNDVLYQVTIASYFDNKETTSGSGFSIYYGTEANLMDIPALI